MKLAANPGAEISLPVNLCGRLNRVNQVIPVHFAEIDAIDCHRIQVADLFNQADHYRRQICQ